MNYAALASGSKGNCHAFSDGRRTLLVDAGISLKQIRLRLRAMGWIPRRSGRSPSPMSTATISAPSRSCSGTPTGPSWPPPTPWPPSNAIHGIDIPKSRVVPLRAGHVTDWEGVARAAFQHAPRRRRPGGLPAGVGRPSRPRWSPTWATPTRWWRTTARTWTCWSWKPTTTCRCCGKAATRPPLKARILSRVGHLSNESMGELLAGVLGPRLRTVILAHLSEQNNDPEFARGAAARGPGRLLRLPAPGPPG